MRNFLIAVLLLLGIMFIITNFAEVEAVVDTLRRGDWIFLALGIFIQIIWMVNVAASYRAIYRALGVDEKIGTLFIQAAAANFVNVVTTSGGMGGATIFIAEAKRKGLSSARATLVSVLFALFEYLGFLCVLAIGIAVLFRRNNLNTPEIAATAILIAITTLITFLLYLGMKSAQSLGNALSWIARQINRLLHPFIHRNYLSEKRGYEFALDAAGGLREIRNNPKKLIFPAALALSNKALLISIFFLIFLAFEVPFTPGTLIAGFSIGWLFTLVSPTPAGVGVVEGVLTLALRSMFIPLGSAAVITLAYRGITFWLPLIYGLIALRLLGKTASEPDEQAEVSEISSKQK